MTNMTNSIYNIRDIKKNDDISVLNELSSVDVDVGLCNEFCEFINLLNDNHRVVVFEIKINENETIIAGIGTIFIERKIIHSFGKVGHIEDIAVSKLYRGLGIGKNIVDYLINYAKEKGCYKAVLNCSNDNIKFYEKCDLKLKSNQMAIYF